MIYIILLVLASVFTHLIVKFLQGKFSSLLPVVTSIIKIFSSFIQHLRFDIAVCTSLGNNVRNASTTYSRTIKQKHGNYIL